MSKRVRSSVSYAGLDTGPDDLNESTNYQPQPKRRKLAVKPKKANTQKAKSHFPFLELPGEIRNMIYEYALTATQGEVDIHRVRDSDTGARTKPMRQTKNAGKKKYKDIAHQLLRANKKIHAEAAPVLYKVNTFRFYDVQDLTIFFGCHAVHVRHLSSITVWAPVYLQQGPLTQQHIETAFSMLAFAENLNYLQLEVVWSKTGRLDDAVRAFFEAARNWLQAVGLRKGSKKAGMDVLDVRQVHIHGRSGWDTRRPWEEFTPLLETKLVS